VPFVIDALVDFRYEFSGLAPARVIYDGSLHSR
jgi:hypothetical protein